MFLGLIFDAICKRAPVGQVEARRDIGEPLAPRPSEIRRHRGGQHCGSNNLAKSPAGQYAVRFRVNIVLVCHCSLLLIPESTKTGSPHIVFLSS